ncbi:hypothetical protein CU097_011164 [Rhizopus azygosporus]|uniref:Uncharacterized protein n=2 Tax=Rhizopus TaxID=4842 RepID=A0A367JM74_RHIAZ|nr:hypothetical protein CU097_011164 [Rhizopus azygosporus]
MRRQKSINTTLILGFFSSFFNLITKMPMVKNLENVHHELIEIARESNRLACRSYTADDIEKLQDRLRAIDSQYNQGAFDAGHYEEDGLAQVSDELERVHRRLHRMLSRIE